MTIRKVQRGRWDTNEVQLEQGSEEPDMSTRHKSTSARPADCLNYSTISTNEWKYERDEGAYGVAAASNREQRVVSQAS